MKMGPRVAAAVAIGYVLGRTRRMKFAIMVGSVLAGRKLKTDPKQLLQKAGTLAASSPELSKLSETVRGRLMEAAKAAATATASNKIDALGESLLERAEQVRNPPSGQEASTETAAEDEQPPAGDANDSQREARDDRKDSSPPQEEATEEHESAADSGDGDQESGRRSTQQRDASQQSGAARGRSSRKSGSAGRSSSRSESRGTPRTRETPSSPRRKRGDGDG
ncbi:hypothetical protein SAMN04487820_11022 [Actinopolyspora mzabensis]|uniref:DNA primase n=1 Tax=Actinopolyspora mzabensis TaxID=995066 RepID=A0A1G9DDG6_ACTMZ|nr:hypothetical protein [Actinopolyspora mzabensis]SDK61913.1 hypothetical protein SAMN04487820_11022 [Actinopolyspora mzabensis]